MNVNNERLRYLLYAYINDRMEAKEFDELRQYVAEADRDADIAAAIDELWAEADVDRPLPVSSERVFHQIVTDPRIKVDKEQRETTSKGAMVSIKRSWRLVAGVAALLCIAFSVLLYLEVNAPKQHEIADSFGGGEQNILPGGNKAMLTLADGRVISLDEVADGDLAEQAGVRIVKTEGGQLFYEPINTPTDNEPVYNVVSTPKGGEYHLVLPDGTKVWLNAVSSLRYPVCFTGSERRVELIGEAYFEVRRFSENQSLAPFIVASADQEVEVLGTHFNVKAYPDEGETKTTLLEGRVRVAIPSLPGQSPVANLLMPNQQSTITPGRNQIDVSDVDPLDAVAWKNGNFAFYESSITEVMNTIARWYDVEVEYESDAVKDKVFAGTISRFERFEKLLETIELTGTVRFRIEGRRVIVMT